MISSFIKKYQLIDYFFLALGSGLMAAGIAVILVKAHVVPGGVTGLSMAIHYLSGNSIPIGLMMWVLNIPLFIWGFIELGKSFGIRTFFGFSALAFQIDLYRGEIPGLSFIRLDTFSFVEDLLSKDFLFFILVGAILLGVGLGLIFKFRGSTGGVDIVVAILQKRYGFKPGQAIMVIDFLVISVAGFIIYIKDLSPERPAMTLTLYAFFFLFVSSRIVDALIDGFDYARMVYIISEKTKEISEIIMNDIQRGGTVLKARGIYRETDREVIFTVVTLKELSTLTVKIKEVDKNAFVVVSDAHEVLGLGFRRRY